MRNVIVLILVTFTLGASAAEKPFDWTGDLYVFATSYHVKDYYYTQKPTTKAEELKYRRSYERAHPMLGYKHAATDWMVAVYRNSQADTSFLFGKYLENATLTPNASAHIFLGLVTGYGKYNEATFGGDSNLAPYGFIGFSFHPENKAWGVEVNTLFEVTTLTFKIRI